MANIAVLTPYKVQFDLFMRELTPEERAENTYYFCNKVMHLRGKMFKFALKYGTYEHMREGREMERELAMRGVPIYENATTS